jgi:hypothetical protein
MHLAHLIDSNFHVDILEKFYVLTFQKCTHVVNGIAFKTFVEFMVLFELFFELSFCLHLRVIEPAIDHH